MSATRNSNDLVQEYVLEIENWDWVELTESFNRNQLHEDCFEDDGYGDRYVYQRLGSIMSLTPSGKIYALWTTNQTEEDVARDSAWWEALDEVANRYNCFVATPVDCGDGDSVWLCKRFDTPETHS